MDQTTELKKRLVIGRKRDGRNCYDPQAKRELIEAGLQPGVSIAKLALSHGINANLLRTWITQHLRQSHTEHTLVPATITPGAFIPVVTLPERRTEPEARDIRLDITLNNGIQADLRCLGLNDVLALLPVLADLPCSVSTRR